MSDPINFAKMAADLDSNPKIRRAGRNGREVYLFVLRRVALLKRQGSVPVSNVEPAYLAYELQMSESEAEDGVRACLKKFRDPFTGEEQSPLLSIERGEIVVEGWNDDWGRRPLTEGERKAKQRAKDKDSEPTEPRDVSGHVTPSPDSHGSDQIRSEEKRSVSDPPAARAIQPSTKLSLVPAPTQNERRTLGDAAWDRINAKRATFGPDTRQLHPMDPGRSELASRLLESGDQAVANLEHVLAIAFAEADEIQSPEYLTGSMFEPRSWRKKLGMRIEDVGRESRAGPRRRRNPFGYAEPRNDHPVSGRLMDFDEAK